MNNWLVIKVVLLFFLSTHYTFSQTPTIDEQLEFLAPRLYKDNQLLFSNEPDLKIEKDIIIDSLNPINFNHTFNETEIQTFINDTTTKFKLKFIDAPIQGTDKNIQTIVAHLKYDLDYVPLPLKEIKLKKYRLTDKFGKALYLKGDSIFRENGGGTLTKEKKTYDRHMLYNVGHLPNDSIKGYIELEFDFISEYEVKKVNKNDSIIVFKDQILKILTFEDNYMKFKGKGTILNFLEYANLNDDNFRVSGFYRDTTSNSKPDISTPGTASFSVPLDELYTPAKGSRLPENWINNEIDTMNLQEYKTYLKQQILKDSANNNILEQDFYCRLDFNTQIQNLFLFMPINNITITKRININHRVEEVYDLIFDN